MHVLPDQVPGIHAVPAGVISVFGFKADATAALRDVLGAEFAVLPYDTEAELLKAISGPRAVRHEAVPHLLLVNLPDQAGVVAPIEGPSVGAAVREPAVAPWLSLIRTLEARVPEQPIVVAADEHEHAAQIEAALNEGADEWVDTAIAPSLLRHRIQQVIERVRERQAANATPAVASADRSSPLTYVDDQAEANAVPTPAPLNAAEAWAVPLDASTADAAVARVEALSRAIPASADAAQRLLNVLRVPDVDLVEPKSGRLDARRIASELGISMRSLASATPVTPQALSASPDSASAQLALHPFARIISALRRLLPEPARKAWLQAPNPQFQNRPPVEAMLAGEVSAIARMLEMLPHGGGGL